MNFQGTSQPVAGSTESTPKHNALYHAKRLLFLGSLYFRLINTKSPDVDELNEANRKLQLAYRSSALAFPAALSAFIWRKVNVEEMWLEYTMDEPYLGNLVDKLVSSVPSWIRYSDLVSVTEDVRKVFETLRFA